MLRAGKAAGKAKFSPCLSLAPYAICTLSHGCLGAVQFIPDVTDAVI